MDNHLFLNILYKDKLLEIVQLGELKLDDQMIRLNYSSENQVSVLFDRKNLDLKGWEIIDQYNNNINFTLNIVNVVVWWRIGNVVIPGNVKQRIDINH